MLCQPALKDGASQPPAPNASSGAPVVASSAATIRNPGTQQPVIRIAETFEAEFDVRQSLSLCCSLWILGIRAKNRDGPVPARLAQNARRDVLHVYGARQCQ